MLHVIKETVLGAHEKIAYAVPIPVNRGWAGGVPGQRPFADSSHILEHPRRAVFGFVQE